jgi:hypothetical protein
VISLRPLANLHVSTGPETAVQRGYFTVSNRSPDRLFGNHQHAEFRVGDKPYFHHFLLLHHIEQLVRRTFSWSFCGLLIVPRVGLLFRSADLFLRCELAGAAPDDHLWRCGAFHQLAQ